MYRRLLALFTQTLRIFLPMKNTTLPQLSVEAVVATDSQGAIGKDNTIPWQLPSDLARFKRLTMGHVVVMGAETARSIGRRLPGRLNLVLTHAKTAPYEQQQAVSSFEQARSLARTYYEARDAELEDYRLFAIGGESIYQMSLPLLTDLHLTTVNTTVEDADRYFPVREFYDMYVRESRVRLYKSCSPEPENGLRYRYAHYRVAPAATSHAADEAQLWPALGL
jgi:dihydrofolate reductase